MFKNTARKTIAASILTIFCQRAIATERTHLQTCNDQLSSIRHSLIKVIIPAVEEKAKREYDNASFFGHQGLFYFDSIDHSVQRIGAPRLLLQQAFRRLPYLSKFHFFIILSGDVGQYWKKELQEERLKSGYSFSVITVPGGIHSKGGRGIKDFMIPHALVAELKNTPVIFFDDTYSSGATAEFIRAKLADIGARLEGVFVVYDSSRGDPSALYKSGRFNTRFESLGNFPVAPVSWRWTKKPIPLTIQLDSYITLPTSEGPTLTLQGSRLMSVLNGLAATVTTVDRYGVLQPPDSTLKKIFPMIQFNSTIDSQAVVLGNFEETLNGISRKESPFPAENLVLTLSPSPSNKIGSFLEKNVSPTYYIDALVESGVFKPVFKSVDLGHFSNHDFYLSDDLDLPGIIKIGPAPENCSVSALEYVIQHPDVLLQLKYYLERRIFRSRPHLVNEFLRDLINLWEKGAGEDHVIDAMKAKYRQEDKSKSILTDGDQDKKIKRARQIMEEFDTPPRVFVDIGAGDGQITSLLASNWDLPKENVFAIDFTDEKKFQNISYLKASEIEFDPLPLSSGSADGVALMMVLHHLKHPEHMLFEAYRLLTPGGTLIIRESDAPDLATRSLNAVVDQIFYEILDDQPQVPRPNNFFEAAKWIFLVKEAGFRFVISKNLEPNNPLNPIQMTFRKGP